MTRADEFFELFDEDDQPLGRLALRSECHGNPNLIHRTAHVIVFDGTGRLLLQRRSVNKDVQPGKWDTAVGGHVDPGETYEQAARREMTEEIGIPSDHPLTHLFNSTVRNEIESENIGVFETVYDGPFVVDPYEVEEIRFWTPDELEEAMGMGILTPSLEQELKTIRIRWSADRESV